MPQALWQDDLEQCFSKWAILPPWGDFETEGGEKNKRGDRGAKNYQGGENANRPQEEKIFAISLPTDTRASSIFNAVKDFYEEQGIPMRNILRCAKDGAPAMVGMHRDLSHL